MRFRDGIGVRIASADAFGEPIEQLQLCTDLAALESAVRERVSRLINFRHVRYVRLRGSERLTNATKDVVVTYDAVPGTRLSEFLELALHAPLRIDIDTALQIVRELLPAIAVLHDSRNVTHGAIGPERLVLTPQGRLVIVDHGLGLALGKLGYSRKRLWQQLRVPVPQGTGKIVFDARTDVIQIGMVALALILGRPIEEADFPQNLERLLDGAKETPSIGQSRSLSNELRAWLDRSLPLEKRVAFATVREAQQEFEKLFSGTRYGASSNALKNLVAKYAAVAQGKAPVEDIPAAAAAGVPTGAPTGATAAPEPIGAPMIENAIERGLGNGRRIAEPPPLARPDDHIPAETEVAVTSLADAVGLGPKGRVRATPTRRALVTPITDPHPRDAGLGAKPPANARAAGAPSSSSLPAINAKSVDIKAPDVKTAGVVKGDAKSTAAKTVDVKTADVKAAGVKGPDLKGTAAKGADAESAQKPAAKAPLAADVAAFEEAAEDTYTDAQVSIATKGTQAANPAASAKIATSDVDAQSILLMDSVDDETPLMPAAAFEDAAPDLDRFAGMGARNAVKKIEAAPVAKAPEVKAPEVKAPAAKAPAVKAPEAKTPELKTPEFKTPEPKTAEPKLAEPKPPVLKVEVKAPEVKAPAAKAPEVKAPAVNSPTVIAPAAKTPAVNVPATIAPAAKGPAVNAPAAKVPAANVPVNVPSMNVPAASDAEASPLFSATPAPTVTSAAPIAVTPAVPAPPPAVPPVAKIPLPGTPVAQPAAPPAAVAPPKVSVPLPSAVPPVVTPVAPAASIATPTASSSVPLPVSKTPAPQAPAVAPPVVAVTPVAAPPVVTTPVAVTPAAVTPVTPAPAAPPVVAVTPVAAPPVVTTPVAVTPAAVTPVTPAPAAPPVVAVTPGASPPVGSTPVTPVAATPVAPAPVAATPAVVTPVAKTPAPVAAPPIAATPVVARPPVAMPSLPEPDLFADSAPAAVEEPAKKKSLASKLWAAVPKPKKAAPPPSIMSVPEEAEESVSAPPAFVAPAATQMPAAASGTPVVQAAPVAQPAPPAAMTPASAKPAATVAPMVPAAAAPVAPVAPAARVHTPAAPTTTPAMPSSPSVDAPPAAAGTPATSTPEEKKSTTFEWHKDVAVTDAVPAWARGRIAGEEPVGNEGAVDFDEASGSLSAQVASASADRVSAFMAAPKPVVIKPEKEAPSPSSPSSSSSSSASSSSSSAREADSSSSETRTLLRPGSGFFGADAADAAAEAEEGEKVVAFKAPRRQMPRIRINWRRTLAASLVVSIMEGVAFATAYWYVIPSETGSLLVETTPAGLEILVDGRVMGRTPFSDSLTPGRHTIELRQGTNSRVIPVEISSGVQTMQRITWAKGLQTGQARVTATAPNSEVTIDGKKWGKAPLTVSTLAAGKHMVQIESDAGTVSTPIAVSPGETTELDVPIYPGWVSVLAPVQLFIYEGERFLGTTEGEKLMLAPGKHTLDFVSEELGYKRSLEVTITPGATAAVSLPMPKVAVTVQGPEGADLIVDGEAMGKLPLTGLQVPLGTRDFVVKHPDHGEKRQVITVTNHAPMRVVMR